MKSFTAFIVAMICAFSLLPSQDLGQITSNTVSSNSVLRLLTIGNKPVIKATDGKRYLAKAKNTFKLALDPSFKELNLDQTSYSTPDTPTNIYEIIADANYIRIFDALSSDLNKLCLTQDQIEEFCLSHSDQVRVNHTTFFLFKENNRFFVARVHLVNSSLGIFVDKPEDAYLPWDGDDHYRVIIPQL